MNVFHSDFGKRPNYFKVFPHPPRQEAMPDSVITNWAQTHRMRKFGVTYGSGSYTIAHGKAMLELGF